MSSDDKQKIYNVDSVDQRLESMKTHTLEELTQTYNDCGNALRENAKIMVDLEHAFEKVEAYQEHVSDENRTINRALADERTRLREMRLDYHLDRAIAQHLIDLKELSERVDNERKE